MAYSFENKRIDSNISTRELFQVNKMEDFYLRVRFRYQNVIWNGAVPIKAKYQGVNISLLEADVVEWVKECYSILDPTNYPAWRLEQESYWAESRAEATKLVFNGLNGEDSTTKWQCRNCGPVSGVNSQAAARIRTLKEKGYFIATVKVACESCGGDQFFDLLVRLPRQSSNAQKRKAISPTLRKRIFDVLGCRDCMTGAGLEKKACVIDHKFPSSRWVNGEDPNDPGMSDAEIKAKFQILSNQSNLQKERYCQRCVLQGVRGSFFGIEWYYAGSSKWEGSSKADENGCIGCPWYDSERWKAEFNAFLDRVREKHD